MPPSHCEVRNVTWSGSTQSKPPHAVCIIHCCNNRGGLPANCILVSLSLWAYNAALEDRQQQLWPDRPSAHGIHVIGAGQQDQLRRAERAPSLSKSAPGCVAQSGPKPAGTGISSIFPQHSSEHMHRERDDGRLPKYVFPARQSKLHQSL